MEITPIQKVNAVDQIFNQLRDQLIDGRWTAGEKLPSENELAEMFNVSRITIRQALQKLKALGLIETHSGAGSYVKNVDVSDAFNELRPILYIGNVTTDNILEFRQMIDTECIRIATVRAKEPDLRKLDRIYDRMKSLQESGDVRQFSKSDMKFHMEIVKMTNNPLMIKTYSILKDVLDVALRDIIDKMRFERAIEYHGKMLQAMHRRDPDEAARYMAEHINVAKDYMVLNK